MKVVLNKNLRRFLDTTDVVRDLNLRFLSEMLNTVSKGYAFSTGTPEEIKEFDDMCRGAMEDMSTDPEHPKQQSLTQVKETMAMHLLLDAMDCGKEFLESPFGEILCDLAKVFKREDFESDPYIRNIKTPEVKGNRVNMSHETYHAHEFFEYDSMMPASWGTTIPRLGFFEEDVNIPVIEIGENCAWPGVSPNTINTMKPHVNSPALKGEILVVGCGMGYFPYMASMNEAVTSITVVEKDPEIADMFMKHILPQFEQREKVALVVADYASYLRTIKDGTFDYCLMTPWNSNMEQDLYLQMKVIGNQFKNTVVEYWIEDSLIASLLSALAVEVEYTRQKELAREKFEKYPDFPWIEGVDGYVQRFIHELYRKDVIGTQKDYEEMLLPKNMLNRLTSKKLAYTSYAEAQEAGAKE